MPTNDTSEQTSTGTPSRKSFNITAADGSKIAVPAGDYYFNTKARCQRMMQNSLSPESRQVYACLELGTMGFQRELAVIMDRGRKRPLTPDDICIQTGLSRQNVRRAISELEDQGLAERRSDDDGGLRKGHVEIYSWAVPREPKCKEDCSQRATTIPVWFPTVWDPLRLFIKRHKLQVVIDPTSDPVLLEEGKKIASDYKEAEIVVSRFLERVCARTDLYKEERTEITIERTEHTHTPVASVVVCEPDTPKSVCAPIPSLKTEPEKTDPLNPRPPAFDPKPSWETFWATYSQTKDARKQDAWEWWRDNVKAAEYAADILDGLNRHIASDQWQRKIGVPDAINFLLKHRYKERPLPASAGGRPQTKWARQADALAQFAAKIREEPS